MPIQRHITLSVVGQMGFQVVQAAAEEICQNLRWGYPFGYQHTFNPRDRPVLTQLNVHERDFKVIARYERNVKIEVSLYPINRLQHLGREAQEEWREWVAYEVKVRYYQYGGAFFGQREETWEEVWPGKRLQILKKNRPWAKPRICSKKELESDQTAYLHLLCTPIGEVHGLSVRTSDRLQRLWIADIVQKSEEEFLAEPRRSFGKVSFQELKNFLEQHGLGFNLPLSPELLANVELIRQTEQVESEKRPTPVGNRLNFRLLSRKLDAPLVRLLGLSNRSWEALKAKGISHFGELIQKREEELLGLKNFDRKSLLDARTYLESLGLGFGIELPLQTKERLKKSKNKGEPL